LPFNTSSLMFAIKKLILMTILDYGIKIKISSDSYIISLKLKTFKL
jgi:hypothetical protein